MKNKVENTTSFIEKANLIHNKKYNYDLSDYINNQSKIEIACSIHGSFWQSPNNHLKGAGCPDCGVQSRILKRLSNTQDFIKKASIVHSNVYSYEFSKYVNKTQKVEITCPIHGNFHQRPNDHLKGSGCRECASQARRSKLSLTTDNFIEKSIKFHMGKYDYSKVNYVNGKTKVIITCPIHGDFSQMPYHHIKGVGCPGCAITGFDKNKPAYLYYLKITTEDNQVLYKIGITNRTVDERFSLTDLSKIEIIKQKLYKNGQDALDWENKLKRKYKEFQYQGPEILSSGNTELFTEDIIELYLS